MEYIVNQDFNKANIRNLFYYLAKENHVTVVEVNKLSFETITPGVAMVNGQIYISKNTSWVLALHELCHLLSVEEQYRYMMDTSTVKSYKKINVKYPEGKELRSESATIGLQHILMQKYRLEGYIAGTFFQGAVHLQENIPTEWFFKGKKLFELLDMSNYIPIEFANIINLCDDSIPDENANIIVGTQDRLVFSDCIYENGKYYTISGGHKNELTHVKKWCLKH